MFCPVCECEYKEGITKCPDCEVDLVDELVEEEPEINEFDALMTTVEDVENREDRGIFISKEQLAEDNKSSGFSMIFVGTAGIILMVLIFLGIIPLRIGGYGQYLTYGVMGAMFIGFLVIGIKSLVLSKKYSEQAVLENSKNDEIISWFLDSFSASEIDADAYKTDDINTLPDIDIYYKRMDNIKDKITAQYIDLDEAFLDKIAEDIFESLYENN